MMKPRQLAGGAFRIGTLFQQDHLLGVYVPEADALQQAVARMKAAGFLPVVSLNSYWNEAGYTFEDPDGCRTVLEGLAWPVLATKLFST